MFDFTYAKIESLVVHHVGSVTLEEGYRLSENIIDDISEEMNERLKAIFLDVFTKQEYYQFTHENELKFNQLHVYAHNIFEDSVNFLEYSTGIVKNLYAVSSHPNIKSGDVWILHLSNCITDDEAVEAIAVFKVEDKDLFLKNDFNATEFNLAYDQGITRKNIEKGCLIFNVDVETGHRVLTIDRLNKADSIYWKESFLQIEKIVDEHFLANNFVKVFNNYVKQADETFLDKSDVVKSTMQYIETVEELNIPDFVHANFTTGDEETAFRTVMEKYEKTHDIAFPATIQLPEESKEKLTKKVRKTVRLGKEVSLIIKDLEQLDAENVEVGFDEQKGKKFVKIYY